MKNVLVALVVFAGAAQANAALTCTIPADTVVIESTVVQLTLSEDGTMLNQKTDLWPADDMMVVKSNVVRANGKQVIKGEVLNPNMACAGSCPATSFELKINFKAQEPNAKLIYRQSGFNEMTGKIEKSEWSRIFNCVK